LLIAGHDAAAGGAPAAQDDALKACVFEQENLLDLLRVTR
jgi:hypothetical protein